MFQAARHVFFVYGFAKNQRDNISGDELKIFKRAAEVSLDLNDAELQKLLVTGELIEVYCHAENL